MAAVLNANVVNEAIKPFQSQGLMGERDIEKKVLELPIPEFNGTNEIHQAIAELGKQAHARAEMIVRTAQLPVSLGRRRALVRRGVQPILDGIDRSVSRLL